MHRRTARWVVAFVMALGGVAGVVAGATTPASADHDLPPAVNGPIAFVVNSDIWYRDAGGTFRQVTRGLTRPAWDLEMSPDGRRIAFSHSTAAGLWVVNLNGTNLRNVIAGYPELSGQGGYDPSWDPSGHRLVFTALDMRTGNHELFTVDPDRAGSLKRLTRFGVGSEAVPSWSPVAGSNEIAYIPCCDGRIKIIDAKTLTERWVTADADPPAMNLDWSPDGTKLAVEAYSDGRLYTVNSDGSNWVSLDPGYSKTLTSPSWSPDGTMIAAQGLDESKSTAVVVVNASTGVPGGVTPLTGDWGSTEFAPTWGPECVEQCVGTEVTAKRMMSDTKIKVAGTLKPGLARKQVEVTLYRLKKGAWRPVASKTPTTNRKGSYGTSFSRPLSGKCGVLVDFAGTKQHMPSYRAIPPLRC